MARGNTLAGYVQHPRHRDVLPGRYTDDTQMSIAVAEWLLGDDHGIPVLADLFVRAYKRDARAGYARGFRGVLEDVVDGAQLLEVLRPESDKSGAAMRAGVIGLLPDIADVRRTAALQARITHRTLGGMTSATAAALAVHYCRYGLGPVAALPDWLAATLPASTDPAVWARPWRGKVGSAGMDSTRAAVTALAAHTSVAALLKACVAYNGDVDTVATIALAAASCSAEYAQDLPEELLAGLENGRYGRDFLAELDARLVARFG
ncbi:ADP-ribosylglycohydrolase family protein [Embleya sp. NBC_00896]|uniref:ADP-ribosylglycohydrolase family protein n=1 Tax=Embleya sp. NBC_00896 TaxID=2975961 RepID=UPI003868CD8A|nr:ADP-ribosylglycohydrolase family protein [Embleya sp. NBC_00896]